MKTKKITLLLTVILFITFTSCKKEESKNLTVTPILKEVTKDAESFIISIVSNIDWTVTSNENWCKPASSSGSNDGSVSINVEENTTTSQRIAVVTIEGEDVNSVTVSVIQDAGSSNTVTDYDGNTYQTVQIGNQVWMAENLRVTTYPDGTAIPNITDNTEWANLEDNNTDDAYCIYNNNSGGEVDIYGTLYTWAAAMGDNAISSNSNPSNVQGVCPDGWHLPSDAEWVELIDYLGGSTIAGGEMKETGTEHWNSPNTGATNSSGFSALPGGTRSYWEGTFNGMNAYGIWWSTTQNSVDEALYQSLYDYSEEAYREYLYKSYGFSVRCIKD